ncbi:MAG: type II/IV secretion system protein [Verrucomicrobia bacterium]|nr:type II/IV secretion system protein [Verrucomicrobiota bacterium]MCH8527620.1 GspE/PulE family protein [Kiritimatiellia bacterium]
MSAPLDLREIQFDPHWALRFPPSLLVRRRMMPLLRWENQLHVAAATDIDAGSRKLFERQAGVPVRWVPATPESLQEILRQLYGDLGQALSRNTPPLLVESLNVADDDSGGEDMAGVCESLLQSGLLRRASDLHFNVLRDGRTEVRMRVDGQLEVLSHFPAGLRQALFNRLKIMARMDIAEKRAPQDGAFRISGTGGTRVDVRAAALPARHGERVTLRLLGGETGSLTLDRLGMDADQRTLFTEALDLPHGMMLITGPTGSGKSTTLYAAIRHLLEGPPRNIMTVEDPVEYETEGVVQTEVDTKGGKIGFATAIRSILRHDPDVIMIGEIRDRETADLAVRAALTGHMVFSTLHTNTAAGAVTRLIDLGLDRFLLGSVLRLVVAQRLARRLCPNCREERPLTEAEARRLHRETLEGSPHAVAPGCLHCAGKGYIGRVGLFECLPVHGTLSEHISRAPLQGLEHELEPLARGEGHRSLFEDAIRKLHRGDVPLDDILRATLEL